MSENAAASLNTTVTEDAALLARIHNASAESEAGAAHWTERAFQELFDSPGVVALVANVESSGAAGMILIRIVMDEAEIILFAVSHAFQRKRVGSRLLSSALTHAAQAGATRMFLEVEVGNLPATALYEKAGFKRSGNRPGYYKRVDGTRADGLILSKPL